MILFQWLFWWCIVEIAVNTTEFGRLRRNGGIIPWYLSSTSDSDAFQNHNNSNWKPYQMIDNKLSSHQQTAIDTKNTTFHLLENEELLNNIRNALQKISSQVNINYLRSIWNSIQNGELGKQIEMFLQQQQQEQETTTT
ncbi:NEDD4-binding protein 2-like [Dirofilaria immitis]